MNFKNYLETMFSLTAILSQGYIIDFLNEDNNEVVVSLQDIKYSKCMEQQEKEQRIIHASQFLYNIW